MHPRSPVTAVGEDPMSMSAWLTHLRSVSAEPSRSRAILDTGYSTQNWTSNMVSSLN